MRSTFKVLFYVNGSKEKNGIVPIMGCPVPNQIDVYSYADYQALREVSRG